jgi:hypothetical protein
MPLVLLVQKPKHLPEEIEKLAKQYKLEDGATHVFRGRGDAKSYSAEVRLKSRNDSSDLVFVVKRDFPPEEVYRSHVLFEKQQVAYASLRTPDTYSSLTPADERKKKTPEQIKAIINNFKIFKPPVSRASRTNVSVAAMTNSAFGQSCDTAKQAKRR